jgi:hypothetical protein
MKLRKLLTRYELEGGSLIPRAYGFSYYLYAEGKAVFYPIPLNLLVNLHRKIRERIIGPSPPKLNKMLHDAYARGRIDGFRISQQRLSDALREWQQEKKRVKK